MNIKGIPTQTVMNGWAMAIPQPTEILGMTTEPGTAQVFGFDFARLVRANVGMTLGIALDDLTVPIDGVPAECEQCSMNLKRRVKLEPLLEKIIYTHPITAAFDFEEPPAAGRRPNPGVGEERTIQQEQRRDVAWKNGGASQNPGSSVRTLQCQRNQTEEPGPHCRIRRAPSEGAAYKTHYRSQGCQGQLALLWKTLQRIQMARYFPPQKFRNVPIGRRPRTARQAGGDGGVMRKRQEPMGCGARLIKTPKRAFPQVRAWNYLPTGHT